MRHFISENTWKNAEKQFYSLLPNLGQTMLIKIFIKSDYFIFNIYYYYIQASWLGFERYLIQIPLEKQKLLFDYIFKPLDTILE